MLGRRVYPDKDGNLFLKSGDYGFDPKVGHWLVRPPGRHAGGIPDHTVVEHEDGTITVSPSILFEGVVPEEGWHGYLEKGVWREA